jgi:hypothetical protein
MIALALSVMLLLVLDKMISNVWLTRKNLEEAQENLRLRSMPAQLFSNMIYHAGNLGCRSVRDGIIIKTPDNIPNSFFIHQGKAIQVINNELWVHETLSNREVVHYSIPEGFQNKTDWILISDCQGAELLPSGGKTVQSYDPPIYLNPIMITRWIIKNQTLSRQQIYPSEGSQPVLTPVEAWEWRHLENLLELRWKIDGDWETFVFEKGNT